MIMSAMNSITSGSTVGKRTNIQKIRRYRAVYVTKIVLRMVEIIRRTIFIYVLKTIWKNTVRSEVT